MDRETATCNSPLMLEPANSCPLILAVGQAETAEFNDQSTTFILAGKRKGWIFNCYNYQGTITIQLQKVL
jgi:hypothetical protein